MGVAEDFLLLADHLATYRGLEASQSDLRRAVSTAYYAVFHLLVEDGGHRWLGGSPAAEEGLQRAFDHGPMKQSSLQFSGSTWTDWHGSQQSVPPALRRVAEAFVDLQEERHLADYNNHVQWTVAEVELLLNRAQSAFDDWASIRTDPMAGNYLLSMLLGKRR